LVGNRINKSTEQWAFGVFEGVTPKRFASGQFIGIFRHLTGSSQTFIEVLEYEGGKAFANEDVYLINAQAGIALNVSPFYVCGLRQIGNYSSDSDLFEYDTVKQDQYIYKSIQSGSVVNVDAQGTFAEIYECVRQMREREQSREIMSGLTFISHSRT
jgi:hypothetical protein